MDKILRWSEALRNQFGERVQKVALDTGAGCPNRYGLTRGGCIFCDARGGGSGDYLRGIPLQEQIEKGLKGAQKHYKTKSVILYFQSYSATNVPLAQFSHFCEDAIEYARCLGARVCGFSVSTRPDLLPQPVLDYLSSWSQKLEVWVELGVQTTDPAGLRWLRRGHGIAEIEDALCRLRKTNVKICAHLIAGIPGECEDQLVQSAMWLASRGVHALKFHPLYVLRGTRLEQLYVQGQFRPLEKEQYCQKLIATLKALPEGIIIQRLHAGVRPAHLVAPKWVLDKESLEREIMRRFEE